MKGVEGVGCNSEGWKVKVVRWRNVEREKRSTIKKFTKKNWQKNIYKKNIYKNKKSNNNKYCNMQNNVE